jgi:hypothetical protein
LAAQRDASTKTIALHFRCIVGNCHPENCTSVMAKAGLQTCGPAVADPPSNPMAPVRIAMAQNCRVVRAFTGRTGIAAAGAVAGRDGREFALLRSLMVAPPLAGLEQHLRRSVLKNRAAAI